MYRSLRDFVAALDAAGQLRRFSEPVDPVLEISAITELESKADAPGGGTDPARAVDPAFCGLGGSALLFESVDGADFPVLVNAYGSYLRTEMALGCHDGGRRPGGFAAIAAEIADLTKPVPPRTFAEIIARGRQFLPLLKVVPKTRSRGACQQVVKTGEDIDLTRLPILRCWPLDGDLAAVGYPSDVNDGVDGFGHPDIAEDEWNARYRGRYITFSGVHSVHARDAHEERPASHNIGMYRLQLLGKNKLAVHWHLHHDGASHWRSWKAKGEPMPIAIALGGESVLPYAATCPLPPGISELLMAGFLNGGGVELVRGKTVPIRVPANAEIIIEGFVSTQGGTQDFDPRDPDAGDLGPGSVFEGPFGDHTGFYSMPDRYPVMTVTAITHRKNAIYPTTVVGLPPQEDYYLGKATERVMGALLKVVVHDIEDYDLPMFGAFHNCAFVRIEKAYALHARKVMHAIWGAGQMAWTKCIFVVDHDVDVHDPAAVLGAASRWCRPGRDMEFVAGPLDVLDHAAPWLGAGTKLGFDCTRKWPGEAVGGRPVAGADDPVVAAQLSDAGAHLDRVRGLPGVLDATIQAAAPGWLLVRVDKSLDEPDAAGLGFSLTQQIVAMDPVEDGAGAMPFVLVLGRDVDLASAVAPFFHWLANSDAARDRVVVGDRMGFDCTPKSPGDARVGYPTRPWPPVVSFPPDVLAAADARRTDSAALSVVP